MKLSLQLNENSCETLTPWEGGEVRWGVAVRGNSFVNPVHLQVGTIPTSGPAFSQIKH